MGTVTFRVSPVPRSAYDPDGALTTQKLPGGITQKTSYDEAVGPTGLEYDGQLTPVTGTDPDTGETLFGTPVPGT